jgi:light-regulated signal transduction histidine kinase (bacteriophytochrome)
MASHDLQEPLRKIRTFSDRLFVKYKEQLDDDGKSNLHRIQRAAERMQNLITDILTFSKISSERVDLVDSDMNKIVSEVLTDMEEELRVKNAHVELAMLPKLRVNPGLMKPLFQNLIGNAMKYCKKDLPPSIKIKADLSTRDNYNGQNLKRYCRIFIEDNGIGFDQRYAEEIFGMFKRLHRNSEFEGTGIGLALCKKIVEQHNGFISARSKVGEGSTFIISLPVLLETQAVN